MVRNDDGVRSGVDNGPGIGRVEDALDDERPVPDGAEPGEVGDRRGRVEQAGDELGDGALERLSEANSSGSVVRRSNHQAGCNAPSAKVFSDRDGGMVRPLRTSRSRGPGTGVSTVSTSAS